VRIHCVRQLSTEKEHARARESVCERESESESESERFWERTMTESR